MCKAGNLDSNPGPGANFSLKYTSYGRNNDPFWNSCHSQLQLLRKLIRVSLHRILQSISVNMERWSNEHRAFAVEAFFKNADSVFRRHFNIDRNGRVPSWMTIYQFRTTVTASDKKAEVGNV